MTPAERARLIEKQEFEAEAKALRQRALAYAKQCRKQERARIKAITTEKPSEPKPVLRIGRQAQPFTHNGETRTIKQWANHLGIAQGSLRMRIKTHGFAAAIDMGGPLRRNRRPADA